MTTGPLASDPLLAAARDRDVAFDTFARGRAGAVAPARHPGSRRGRIRLSARSGENGQVTTLTEEQIETLPLRELAFAPLQRMDGRSSVDFVGFLQGVIQALPARPGVPQPLHGCSLHGEPRLAYRLAEAWDWLYVNGLTASDPIHGRTFRVVTARGQGVLAERQRLPE